VTRFKLIVEYDGTGTVGWQRQDTGLSIQSALEKAIFHLTNEITTVTGAGRTDAGVHAMAQVAHFDLSKDFAADKIRDGLNHFLRPANVVVLRAEVAAPDFHARFPSLPAARGEWDEEQMSRPQSGCQRKRHETGARLYWPAQDPDPLSLLSWRDCRGDVVSSVTQQAVRTRMPSAPMQARRGPVRPT